jgi:AraC-like DNA-binding protein
MARRIHDVTQHKLSVQGIEALTLVSNHLPRHAHDQLSVGLIAFGAQHSWSGVGVVRAGAGDCIMANPGEMHDGIPIEGKPRGWRMIYLDSALITEGMREEFVEPVEIVRPVARDPLLARHFSYLFASLTAAHPDDFAAEEQLLRSLVCLLRRHGMAEPQSSGPAPCVAKAIRRLDSSPDEKVSLAELAALSGVSRYQLLRGFIREIGITPHAYLIQLRVRLARRLLADRQTPAEAAILAGFADQSHMTRAFVRQLGVTPS